MTRLDRACAALVIAVIAYLAFCAWTYPARLQMPPANTRTVQVDIGTALVCTREGCTER